MRITKVGVNKQILQKLLQDSNLSSNIDFMIRKSVTWPNYGNYESCADAAKVLLAEINRCLEFHLYHSVFYTREENDETKYNFVLNRAGIESNLFTLVQIDDHMEIV